MQHKSLKLIKDQYSWEMEIQSSISLYFIENVHMYIHIVHEYIFTFKNIEGLQVSIPVYSEIVCIIVYKKWTKFLAPLKYHQKLNVNFPCKCSLTAQNVFTCSAWRHVLVLYTVAIVKIFFIVGYEQQWVDVTQLCLGFFFFLYMMLVFLYPQVCSSWRLNLL